MPDPDPEAIERWLGGWVRSRRIRPPERDGAVFHVEPGQPGRTFEFVTTDASHATVTRAADLARRTPGANWVTVITPGPEASIASLRAAGLSVESPTEWFMTTSLAGHPRFAPPAPYRLDLREEGAVLVASVADPLGEAAASGRIGLSGADAVPDKIETSLQHRRRGLGAAVMGALTSAALERGAAMGLLVASSDGERLYRRLGWATVARVVIGRTRDRSAE